MDSDFRPVRKPVKSQQAAVAALPQTNTPVKTIFQTPDQVAADEAARAPLITAGDQAADATASWWQRLVNVLQNHRREWLGSLVIVLVCGSLSAFVVMKTSKKATVAAVSPHVISKPVQPTTVPSALSGLPVAPATNKLPVTGVMIENSLQARPQSGLSQAGVVFEAIAEGGVTRFLALFQDTAPANIGPIRSARPYYIQWAMGFDAGYAHVGGSPDALSDIKQWGVRDLDQFYNSGAYHRVSSREAPHNVYTAVQTLQQLEAGKGYTSSTFSGFARKPDSPAKVPTARSINMTMSGPAYNVHYDYVAASNSYNRSEGGAPHIDANTNLPISPKVVVALVLPYSLGALDSSGAYYSNYNTIGSGQAYVFQDGTVTVTNWQKTDSKSQFTFSDANGKPVSFNAGQTWLTAVAAAGNVSYSP